MHSRIARPLTLAAIALAMGCRNDAPVVNAGPTTTSHKNSLFSKELVGKGAPELEATIFILPSLPNRDEKYCNIRAIFRASNNYFGYKPGEIVGVAKIFAYKDKTTKGVDISGEPVVRKEIIGATDNIDPLMELIGSITDVFNNMANLANRFVLKSNFTKPSFAQFSKTIAQDEFYKKFPVKLKIIDGYQIQDNEKRFRETDFTPDKKSFVNCRTIIETIHKAVSSNSKETQLKP